MENIRKIIFILIFIALAAGCAGKGTRGDGLLLSEAGDGLQADTESGSGSDDAPASGAASTDGLDGDNASAAGSDSVPLIYVQVSGAVNKPGVYALPDGSRVFQAVELAGGLTEEAELRSLNQAQPLTDGEMVWVMTAEEAAAEGRTAGNPSEDAGYVDDGKVNLNTATKEELMELPGIGAAKAASILAWREANGSFMQIEDLMKIEGIKEGVFSKIEDYVKVQ